MSTVPFTRYTLALVSFAVASALSCSQSHAQVFSSGSTGADGALTFSELPVERVSHNMVYDSTRQRIVLFGGQTLAGSLSLNDTWEWDGTSWTKIDTPNSPPARIFHRMAFDSNRNVVVLFGGTSAFAAPALNDTWEYDGTTWTQKTPANSPTARALHGLAFDAVNNLIVAAGGTGVPNNGIEANANTFNDTWTYDGTNWTQAATTFVGGASVGVRRQGFVYDSTRQVIVSHGGFLQKVGGGVNITDTTMEWNGTAWTERVTSNKPPSDISSTMYFDSARSRVVYFTPGDAANNQTWIFNGLNWLQLSPATSPFRRNHKTTVAYDAARDRGVLFGGDIVAAATDGFPILGISTQKESDTWVFDGSTWSAPTNAQPEIIIDMTPKVDGVFNHTTINIPSGIAIAFKRNAANTPLRLLATGNVVINGVISIDGQKGAGGPFPGKEALGGPGGFDGGLGGVDHNLSGFFAGTPGQGPGGGRVTNVSNSPGAGAGYSTAGIGGTNGGGTYGNILIQPLIGGSGGSGRASVAGGNGGNGGGGGGAILIASTTSISIPGTISADGGDGEFVNNGGGGSGGAIRLVAPSVVVSGTLSVLGGSPSNVGDAGDGRIRIEALSFNSAGATIAPASTVGPVTTVDLPNLPTISITNVAGIPVPAGATGALTAPDISFNNAGVITVTLASTNVPAGTVITVTLTISGQTITANSTPTDVGGNATADLTVPTGVGTLQASATFTPP